MFQGWTGLTLSGATLGIFVGLTTFLLIYLITFSLFKRRDEDIMMLFSLVTVFLMLLAYYDFSLQSFLESAQTRGTLVHEEVVISPPFMMMHFFFIVCSYIGVHLSRFILCKKLAKHD